MQCRNYNEAGGGSRLLLLWKILLCYLLFLIVHYFCNVLINEDKYLTIYINAITMEMKAAHLKMVKWEF